MSSELSSLVQRAKLSSVSLEEMLLSLSKYGCPRVSQFSDGEWYCGIEMHINAIGAKFEVRSGFKHRTPTEAAIECCERVDAVLKDIGGMRR